MNLRHLWAFAWITWLAWFMGWETMAFILKRPDLTLSDFVWRFEGHGWTAGKYFVVMFLVWLALHLSFKWFR